MSEKEPTVTMPIAMFDALEAKLAAYEAAAQAVVDNAGRKGKRLKYQTEYTVKADIVDALAALTTGD